ncbi:MAG: hypothetical protein HY906_11805 [Deltaproteobacteria bacterium]|nr:hypothetical protein [Deltaproteobacteria bacterium]
MTPPQCQTCGTTVCQADTLYAPNGDVLCPRCYEVAKAHREIEQACTVNDLPPMATMGDDGDTRLTRDEADDLHRMVDGVAPRPPHLRPTTVTCATCRRIVPAADARYGSDGLQLCTVCAAAARRRQRTQRITLGIVFLLIAGVQIVLYFLRP